MEPPFVKDMKTLAISVGIGEASRISGATVTQIRYWQKKGLIKSFTPKDGRNKRFDVKNLVAIIRIREFLEEGYTLAKVSEIVRSHQHQSDRIHALIKQVFIDMHENDDGSTSFTFGPLTNRPDCNIEARVTDETASFDIVPRETV
ncbi:MerR family transcriptional regulator [Lacticaseibacillus zhaodongensis]|uniref:MerR family transcriptional regulator n=1 Tax=Lacticaseibacillus zhaodongensis TaxID=2668065 RepID=UPI0012D2BA61|nr:MerR family transcriptional regulator [Lacticaseibacillus zhaodongensis]